MTAREGFALAVRIGGGWEILQALSKVYFVIVKSTGLPTGSQLPLQVSIDSLLFELLLGILVLVLAEPFTRLVYGAKSKAAE